MGKHDAWGFAVRPDALDAITGSTNERETMNEQSERYELLADAIRECALRGVSDKALETLCLESGFSSKHLAQTMNEVRYMGESDITKTERK